MRLPRALPPPTPAAPRRAASWPGLREENAGGFVFHPYPVTPYHADYLHHLDRIEAVGGGWGEAALRQRRTCGAKGPLAETIVAHRWRHAADAGDIVIEEVPVEDLLAAAGVQLDGWSGPPWIREGWFHAYRLLAPGLEAAEREAVEQAYEPLIRGETRSIAEHVDLERRLVAALVGPCRRLVVGYVPRLEFLNERVSGGCREHRLQLHERPQLARLHSYREAQGLPLERQVASWRAPARRGSLEPGRAGSPTRRDG